jgi:MFS family permease
MGAGALLNIVCVLIALSGVELMQFLAALLVLGVGWNFLYTGTSTLLTRSYTPEEKNKAQGAMDTCVFATMAFTSFASGALVTTQGWTWLNLGSLLPIAVVCVALLWLTRHPSQRRSASAG